MITLGNAPSILRPGETLNDVLEHKWAAYEKVQATQRELSLLPDGIGVAQTAVARTEAALAQATAFEASERAHVEGVEEQARAAAEVRSMAERSASLAQQDREAAIEIERAAFARGVLVVEVDVAAAQAASEAAARRVSVLRVEEMKAKEPLAAAQASYASAVDRRRTAAFKLAHAKAAAAAVEQCEAFVAVVGPLLADAETAARAGFGEGVAALRAARNLKHSSLTR